MGDKDSLMAMAALLSLIVASIIYRVSRGRPVLAWSVPGASFLERFASGHSGGRLIAVGRARSCLLVAIASGQVLVRPLFPFNLMFLPEIFGIELEIPIEKVERVKLKEGLWRSVELRYQDGDGSLNDVVLQLRQPEDFVAQLKNASEGAAAPDA